jgi:hypothetical protein
MWIVVFFLRSLAELWKGWDEATVEVGVEGK